MNRLRDLALSDTGFVFDPYSGATFTVNATGLCILSALKDELTVTAIAARLAERFDVRGSDLTRDVHEFIEALRQHGLAPEEQKS